MPHSIFFHKGYAIHGTNYIRRLGGPATAVPSAAWSEPRGTQAGPAAAQTAWKPERNVEIISGTAAGGAVGVAGAAGAVAGGGGGVTWAQVRVSASPAAPTTQRTLAVLWLFPLILFALLSTRRTIASSPGDGPFPSVTT